MANTNTEIKTVLDLLEHESESFHTFIGEALEVARKRLAENSSNFNAGDVFKMTHKGIRNAAAPMVFNKAEFSTFILGAIAHELMQNMSDNERAELATIELKEVGYEVQDR